MLNLGSHEAFVKIWRAFKAGALLLRIVLANLGELLGMLETHEVQRSTYISTATEKVSGAGFGHLAASPAQRTPC